MPRTGRRYGDGKSSTELWRWRREKAEEETAKNDDDVGFITRLRSKKKPRHGLHRASMTPKMATCVPRSKPKVTGDVARAVNTVPSNYRIAIRFKIQITPKFE